MVAQWYTKRWVVVCLHILFWILLLVAPLLLRPSFSNSSTAKITHENLLWLHAADTFARMIVFYANAYFFLPKLVYKRKFFEYIAALIASLMLMLFVDRTVFQLLISGVPYLFINFLVFNLPFFLFIIITSSAFRLIQDKLETDKKIKERENENLKTELAFLRSQVSPHFMFNVLNNMVALARKKSDALEPSLIKLASLLRYMLYETDEEKVLVEKEVEYLQSYIDLQRQRFGKNVDIQTKFEPIESGYTIEPMLLIPFVENAFKHGTGLINDARIEIEMSVAHGTLNFTVRNRYLPAYQEQKDKTSGIGLTNVKRRLNLLYDRNHALDVLENEGWFKVSLALNLH